MFNGITMAKGHVFMRKAAGREGKILIAGPLSFLPENPLAEGLDQEIWEVELTIITKKRYKVPRHLKGSRIDQALCTPIILNELEVIIEDTK